MNNECKNNVTIYACAICGKNHSDLEGRIACETACLKKKKEEAAKVAELKKKEEYEASCAELTKAIDIAYMLFKAHLEKYGEYKYNGSNKELNSFRTNPYMSKLFNYFLF